MAATDRQLETAKQFIEKELYRCIGLPSTAFGAKPAASLTVSQLQHTIQRFWALSTVYYIAHDVIPQVDEKGREIYFHLCHKLTRKWIRYKVAGFILLNPNLVSKMQKMLTKRGLRLLNWREDKVYSEILNQGGIYDND